jgi:hypothetical protein
VIETAERFADGAATADELARADQSAHEQYSALLFSSRNKTRPRKREAAGTVLGLCDSVQFLIQPLGKTPHLTELPALHAAVPLMSLAHVASHPTAVGDSGAAQHNAYQAELAAQADLLRCIIGNPFRPRVSLAPSLLQGNDGLVRRLAEEAYQQRLSSGLLDNARLAVLADALEEAGCTDADLLGHLRGPGPHTRACWCLDLVLARE